MQRKGDPSRDLSSSPYGEVTFELTRFDLGGKVTDPIEVRPVDVLTILHSVTAVRARLGPAFWADIKSISGESPSLRLVVGDRPRAPWF